MPAKEIVAKIRSELDGKRAEAQKAWSTFDAERKSFLDAVSKGEVSATDADALQKLHEISLPYDSLKADIALLEVRWQQAVEMAGQEGVPVPSPGPGGPAPAGRKRITVGGRYTDTDAYKGFVKALRETGLSEKASVPDGSAASVADRDELKALIQPALKTLLTSSDTSAGDLVPEDRQPGVVLLAQPAIRITDVVTVGDTDSDTVEYVKETTFTNAAAETAEDTEAPESAIVYDLVTENVREITHFIPATKRILSDAGQLRTLIDSRLAYGVRKRLQAQMLTGNGSGENLRGIKNTSGINSQALGSDSRSDAVHKAMTLIRLDDENEPGVIVGNPADFEQVFLEKDANGNYIYGPPSMPGPRTIWGLLPIMTTAIAAGDFLVGDFRQATLWVREGLTIAASDSHSDYFTKRKVAVLAAFRAAFGVTRPSAFAEVTGV